MPPLMAPQPTWKQEARPEPAAEKPAETQPVESPAPDAKEVKPDEGSQS
jgi:hypothetical protein